MAKIILTEQDVLKAKSYIPIMEKEKWVQTAAPVCIDKMMIAAKEGDFNLPMPAMFKDNLQRKSRCLMTAFVVMYLGRKIDITDDGMMGADDYDRYAGSHVFNQLERLKGKAEVRDKVFDILSDYRDLEKRLNTEVYNLMQIQNDGVSRQMAMMQMQTTPEALQSGMAELKKLTDQLGTFKAEKAGEVNG